MKKILYSSMITAVAMVLSPFGVNAQTVTDFPLAGDVAPVPPTPVSDWMVTFLPYLLIPLAVLVVLFFALKLTPRKKAMLGKKNKKK